MNKCKICGYVFVDNPTKFQIKYDLCECELADRKMREDNP